MFAHRAEHDPQLPRYFGDELDAFLRADVLGALYGDAWESILVVRGEQAMLHTIVPTPIPGTSWSDVEPFYGYAGPVFQGASPEFVDAALAAYRGACRQRGLIAEVIRFQPERANHRPFEGRAEIGLHEGRLIAYLPIVDGTDEEQLSVYTAPCQRQVRSARKRLSFRRLGESRASWATFAALYRASLTRNGAAPRWFMDDACLDRVQRCPAISLWGVFDDARPGRLLSASLVVSARDVVHTLFVANVSPRHMKGACELLTHEIARAFRERGARWLCLGGGRTNASDDALLAFKLKFGRGHARPLPLGRVIHDTGAFELLCARAAQHPPHEAFADQVNELPACLLPYRLAAPFVRSDAVPTD